MVPVQNTNAIRKNLTSPLCDPTAPVAKTSCPIYPWLTRACYSNEASPLDMWHAMLTAAFLQLFTPCVEIYGWLRDSRFLRRVNIIAIQSQIGGTGQHGRKCFSDFLQRANDD